MPILPPSGPTVGVFTSCGPTPVTAQTVVNSVSTDLLQRIAPEDPVLLDYINRVQLQLLRISRWVFLQSPPVQFITQTGQSNYWVGPVGQGPVGVFDTGLNLANLGPIKTDTFYDRSNFRLLKRTQEQLLSNTFTNRDTSSRPGPPRMWRNAPDTPCIINIYPAPDNQNIYQPTPEAPVCSSLSGIGALLNRIYFVRTTLVDSFGNESNASAEARVFVPANSVLVVQPPVEIPTAASGIQYNRFNVYIFNAGSSETLVTGAETKVTASPLAITAPYQEPGTGFLTGGASYPTANNIEPMYGYIIEFRYYATKPQVNSLTDTLLVPADYFDVLVAGVNMFTAQFLKDESAQAYWQQEYQAGVTGMIRDKNLFPKGPQFMAPDPTSNALMAYYGYETVDQANFPFGSG
jgi:hypothetical protein